MSRALTAFSLIELVCVLALFSLLAAILLPAFLVARECGRSAVCLAHEREIGQGLLMYAEDWDGCLALYAERLDGSGAWWEVLPAYCRSRDLFRCPDAVESWGCDYGVNYLHVVRYPAGLPWVTPETAGPARLDGFARPAETLALADGLDGALSCPQEFLGGHRFGLAPRHRGGLNALFLDGHARWMRPETLIDARPGLWGHFDR